MHFRTAASIALLACASRVAAEAMPYKPVMRPVLGMSLVRRDTPGYQPEQTVCGNGNTCAEACGSGYTECASNDDSIHCYNPDAKQTCCADSTGNSCDNGFYCTHDTKGETMCCPDTMNLAECAAAYSVAGGLQTAEPTTSTAAPSTLSSPSSSSVASSTVFTTTSSTPLTTPTPSSTYTPTTPSAVTETETLEETVTTSCATSSGYTTAWVGSNSTISSGVPTQPVEPVPNPVTSTTGVASVPTSGAAMSGVSALLLAVAGAVALL